jgi:hypothetical protein
MGASALGHGTGVRVDHRRPLARIVSGLVMEPRYRASLGSRLRRKGGPPVVEIAGLSPAEQDALLEFFHARYWGQLPVNFPEVPVHTGSVTDSLWYLSTRVFGLSGPVGSQRALAFPRFALGLLASIWAANHPNLSLQELQNAHHWLVRELRKRREEGPLEPDADRLLREMEAHLPGFGRVGSLAGMGLTLLRFRLARPRPDRVALRWWGRALRVPRGGANSRREAVAIRLFHFFRPRAHDREDEQAVRAEKEREDNRNEFLAASFLADLDAHYGVLRRLNKKQPPVMLLKVDGPEGRALLDVLLGAYRTAFRDVGQRRSVTRPVVLVTSGDGGPGLPQARPFDELEALLDAWTLNLEGNMRERRLLRVTVPGRGEASAEGPGGAPGEEGRR